VRRHRAYYSCSSLPVVIPLRPCAAEDVCAFRRQIGLQCFPRHERDILAFDIGADRIGRVVEGEAGTLAGHGRRRQRHRADLEQGGLDILVPFRRRGLAGVALLLLDIERDDDGLDHRFHSRRSVDLAQS